MTPFIAKLIWIVGIVAGFAIRYPHNRRSRRVQKVRREEQVRQLVLMTIAVAGLVVVPLIHVLTRAPRFANYPFHPLQGWLGAAVFAAALWLLYRSHKDLGRNFSVSLDIRERHSLVTGGVYSQVRHPMYSAFFLWALAQALLLPNWVAGLAGIVGFGTFFFFRVGHEERLMTETFGDEYRRYMQRTRRIIPGLY